MNTKILLTEPGRFMVKRWEQLETKDEDGDFKHGYVEYEVTKADSLSRLWYKPIYVQAGVTLRSLMVALRDLEGIEALDNLVGGVPIAPFIQEAFQERMVDPNDRDQVHTVEMYWYSTLDHVWVSKSGKNDYEGGEEDSVKAADKAITIFPSCHGLGTCTEVDPYGHHQIGDTINYAIEMTPVNELMHCRLRLNASVELYDESGSTYPKEPTLKAVKVWTLGDLLYGLFWELSWFGGPVERDEMRQSLIDQIGRIERGEEKLISMEETRAEFAKLFEDLGPKADD